MVLKLSPADGAAFDFHECLVDEGEAFEANTQPLEVVQPRDYRLLADDSRSWNDRCYSYDAADNRTGAFSRQAKQTIVANALNQMQTVNGQLAQYDAAGNLLEDEARQYDWDAEHRLIRIRYKAQASKETRFGYDGLGRRTVITEVDGTGTTETHYVWCGQAICQKRDANGQLLRAYYSEGEYGLEIGKRVAKADAGIEADEDGDERYGRDRDGDDGKSESPAETTGSLITPVTIWAA
ncbi:hypothetical protein RSp0157 [Ralstonia pseudosolanacearum GMI1000]|uniref:Teneurin-like YD-shell domain-containing protein n=1 Tax=Ralstonia nicotianae (strain ATCC BAA-1114 / GMI1000) TaxID=267608 RepID=Q8XTF5_RALN1|nr:hypothetical protein RSp0157 [Ralstonia pseudosolanacearum GMI1000]